MLEVQLELVAAELVWSPDLLKNSAGTGVRDMVESWLRGMLEAGTLLNRLDTGEGASSCTPGEGALGREVLPSRSSLARCFSCCSKCAVESM